MPVQAIHRQQTPQIDYTFEPMFPGEQPNVFKPKGLATIPDSIEYTPSSFDEKKVVLPTIPQLPLPLPEVRNQVRQLVEAAERKPTITPLSEGLIHKKLINIFKENVDIRELCLSSSLENAKIQREGMKQIERSYREIKEENESTKSKIYWAKVAQIALAVFSVLALVVVVVSTAFTAGATAAFIPALLQALSTTAYTATQAALTAATTTTSAVRLYLDSVRDKHEKDSIDNRHRSDVIQLEQKMTRQEWDQIAKEITHTWSLLRQVIKRRNQELKMIGG